MIWVIAAGGYLTVGLMTGLVAAYKIRLDERLADVKPNWEYAGMVAVGLTLFWMPAALIWCVAQVVKAVGRGIDTAVDVEVQERHARDQDADP